jgi:hypothetical protein
VTQILIESRPWTLERLITRLQDCIPTKQVIMGPGYCGPKLEFYPSRFMSDGVQLAHGCYAQDHNPELRPKKYLVPEVSVKVYLEFLRTIDGKEMEGWKGDWYRLTNEFYCYIGLPGEVGLGVVGIHEDMDVTILSAYL